MITVRRAGERHHERGADREAWSTFYPTYRADSLSDGFGSLELLDEVRLRPGGGVPHRHGEADVITYVREGVLAYDDAMGHAGVLYAGQFQRVTIESGLGRSERNASQTKVAHVFQILLRPWEVSREASHEEKRFSAAERRSRLRVVASPDARMGSLRVSHDASVFSALLDPGQHVVHELCKGRSAWLHVVDGELTLGDVALAGGDGAGVTAERALSVTAREVSEILLIDLANPQLGVATCAPTSRESNRDTGHGQFAG